jgi:hypothetical protein
VWLGVMIGINIQTSFLTPPFGFALFYLRGVAPAIVKTISMYKGVIPFILMQLLVLAIVGFSPRLVNYLPHRVTLGAATAPPPVNPGLQYCIEQYVAGEFAERGAHIRAAIAKARSLDLASLPEDMRKDLSDSFAKAEAAFVLMDEVAKAEAALDARAVTYRPVHTRTREIQAVIRTIDAQIHELRNDIPRLPADAEERKKSLEAQLATLDTERKRLQSTIPANWESEHKAFGQLLTADRRVRLLYRRGVDSGYEPAQQVVRVLEATPQLVAARNVMEGLRGVINGQEPAQAAETVAAVTSRISAVPGAENVRAELAKVRRALTSRTPDKAEALKALDQALKVYEAEVAWREKASQSVLPELRAYEATIRDTIGIRKQEKLPQHIVPLIAACTSHHRNLSLQF